jgi:hypothetical protein
MPRVGFEPMIPTFERAKAVHALDRAVTVIARGTSYTCINKACVAVCIIMYRLTVLKLGKDVE